MILGDRSMAMAAFYSREHDKKRRANSAMQRIEDAERAKLGSRTTLNQTIAMPIGFQFED